MLSINRVFLFIDHRITIIVTTYVCIIGDKRKTEIKRGQQSDSSFLQIVLRRNISS